MDIQLSRRRTLSERQRRKKILDPSMIDKDFQGQYDSRNLTNYNRAADDEP